MAKATIHPRFIMSIWVNDTKKPGFARKTFVLRPELVFWFNENNVQAPYDVQYDPLTYPLTRNQATLVFANEDDAIMFKLKWDDSLRLDYD